MHPYHPYLAHELAAERQAQMLRDAQTTRLAWQAAGEYPHARARTVLDRWTWRVHRVHAALVARIRLHQGRPSRRATTRPA